MVAEYSRIKQSRLIYAVSLYFWGQTLRLRCMKPSVWWPFHATWLVGLDLFNDDTHPSGHISRPTQVNVSQSCFHALNNYSSLITLYTFGGSLKLKNYIISDRRIPLLAGILLCKSQELSRREHSTSWLCSIHHGIPVTMHTPAAYGQWSVFDHNGDNQLVVFGTRYGIWWPWYGQFEVGWLQPLQPWLSAGTSFSVGFTR